MLFGDLTHFDPGGGPWQGGYLRAEDSGERRRLVLQGHFHNDPCMPGTLMFEGRLQAMAFYLTWLGFTLDHDGWRFEPIRDEACCAAGARCGAPPQRWCTSCSSPSSTP